MYGVYIISFMPCQSAFLPMSKCFFLSIERFFSLPLSFKLDLGNFIRASIDAIYHTIYQDKFSSFSFIVQILLFSVP